MREYLILKIKKMSDEEAKTSHSSIEFGSYPFKIDEKGRRVINSEIHPNEIARLIKGQEIAIVIEERRAK